MLYLIVSPPGHVLFLGLFCCKKGNYIYRTFLVSMMRMKYIHLFLRTIFMTCMHHIYRNTIQCCFIQLYMCWIVEINSCCYWQGPVSFDSCMYFITHVCDPLSHRSIALYTFHATAHINATLSNLNFSRRELVWGSDDCVYWPGSLLIFNNNKCCNTSCVEDPLRDCTCCTWCVCGLSSLFISTVTSSKMSPYKNNWHDWRYIDSVVGICK